MAVPRQRQRLVKPPLLLWCRRWCVGLAGEEEMMMMVGSAASEPRRRCGGVTQMVARSDEDGGEDGVKILAGKDGGSPEKSVEKVFPAAAADRRRLAGGSWPEIGERRERVFELCV
ncbi:hypothetical protein Tco_0229794 [Tanacetum coccineum]